MGKNKRPAELKTNVIGYLLILPALALILVVGVIPILQTVSYSFQYYRLTDPGNESWVGLGNYIQLLNPATLEGGRFYNALKNTLVFAAFSIIGELVIGYIGALLMSKEGRLQGLTRVIVLIPWAIPGIIIAQMFSFMFNDQLGVINQILITLGIIQENVVWLANKGTAMAAVVIADVWKQFPFVALMLLSGLQVIDKEQYEAAQVDGAGKIRQFFSITLPNIKPVLLVVLLFRTMGAIRIFDIIYGMTGGGPANSTDTILNAAYQYIFSDLNYGLGSAMATIITLIIFGLSLIYLQLFREKEGA